MKELGDEVEAWKQGLPAFLNADQVDARMLTSLFHRQNNMLTLAYGHALILIFRPCLFNDFKHKLVLKDIGSQVNANVHRCLTGAMSIAAVVDQMVESNKFYPTSWVCSKHITHRIYVRRRLTDVVHPLPDVLCRGGPLHIYYPSPNR